MSEADDDERRVGMVESDIFLSGSFLGLRRWSSHTADDVIVSLLDSSSWLIALVEVIFESSNCGKDTNDFDLRCLRGLCPFSEDEETGGVS